MHGAHVAPILNGLGALKSDELFAVYDAVQRRLSQLGLRLIQPLMGEFFAPVLIQADCRCPCAGWIRTWSLFGVLSQRHRLCLWTIVQMQIRRI